MTGISSDENRYSKLCIKVLWLPGVCRIKLHLLISHLKTFIIDILLYVLSQILVDFKTQSRNWQFSSLCFLWLLISHINIIYTIKHNLQVDLGTTLAPSTSHYTFIYVYCIFGWPFNSLKPSLSFHIINLMKLYTKFTNIILQYIYSVI